MAMRGTEAKKIIREKILETFEGSFIYQEKEIRIPILEDGYRVEVKVALTCAKENVGVDKYGRPLEKIEDPTKNKPKEIYPSQKEQDDLHNLMESLGIL